MAMIRGVLRLVAQIFVRDEEIPGGLAPLWVSCGVAIVLHLRDSLIVNRRNGPGKARLLDAGRVARRRDRLWLDEPTSLDASR